MTVTDDTAPAATPTMNLVYVGMREYKGGVVRYSYEDPTGKHWGGTKKPLVAGAPIGALIEVTLVDPDHLDTSYYVAGEHRPRLVGAHGTDEQRIGWEVEHRAVRAAQDQAAAERRLATALGSPLEDRLREVRDALDRLPRQSRRAALGSIIAYLAQ